MPNTELDLQKAKGKSLAAHFKKEAAFHEKKADHHEKCMKAHEGAQEHHEEMGKTDGLEADEKTHHKTKAAFHKTMAGHHEKMHKLHKGHAEHHAAMAVAHGETAGDSGAVKAAFSVLGVELEALTETKLLPTGEPTVIKTETTATDPNKTTTTETSAASSVLAAIGAEGDPLGVQKVWNEGVLVAAQTAVKELLASPEFKKTIQEEVGNTLLKRLGEQAQNTTVRTFAVPRTEKSAAEVARESLASGTTPVIDTTGVDPEFAKFVTLGEM